MEVIKDKGAMRQFSRQLRMQGQRIGFVPTMGYLHDGHLGLVKLAQSVCDVVIVSIYVNPTQFSANEDFDVYPRNAEEDHRRLRELNVVAVFEPDGLYAAAVPDAAMVVGRGEYVPDQHDTFVTVEHLQAPLCGRSRPHFFRGVATVVSKLFNIVEPDVAVFGKKDYQQFRVISTLVRDLDFDIEIVGAEIAREADGLASSSRNARLSPAARQAAPCIYRALQTAAETARRGGEVPAAEVTAAVRAAIADGGGVVDYVEAVDAMHLGGVEDVTRQPTLLAVAAVFPGKGSTSVRLIDNIVLT